ncbi:hypothetical protein [Thauera phenolivorans]|uniref:hypothetical protein n=1 Tax=Thauera phenolivorans TaxID=1792543 RepID=UPI00083A672F|nr:hypothetical protein [Thauera phenolivorans]
MDAPFPLVLDAAQAAFVCGGVSISAASCRRGGLPNLARATGCRVGADRRTLNVLFASAAAAALLEDVRCSGRIAVTFSEPPTHRTVQFKGSDARILPPEPDDGALAAAYVDAFASALTQLGYSGEVIRAVLASEADELVAVSFTPSAGFSQTPGPNAGTALGAGR